jgi:hypothetical protein
MSIRAILKDGKIQPVDPLPCDWIEGQVLSVDSNDVETTEVPPTKEELDAWEAEMEDSARRIPPDEHERFLQSIESHRSESKSQMRREWGLE